MNDATPYQLNKEIADAATSLLPALGIMLLLVFAIAIIHEHSKRNHR